MFFQKSLAGALAFGLTITSAWAGEIVIMDPYVRASGAMGKTGAAFMKISNQGTEDDTLIQATSDLAKRIELHTHIEAGNGIMQMREIEGGIPIPAGGTHSLERGGDHIMFMGLTRSIKTGDVINVTLTFESAGEMTVKIPVDMEREPDQGEIKMDHSENSNGG